MLRESRCILLFPVPSGCFWQCGLLKYNGCFAEFRSGAVEDLEMNRAFWEGKKVIVTGNTGFKGSWLSL
jgi:hypothetical protein